ncbi:hypothetical protein [Nocardia sp. CDC160]|uniref:hypothetical protein n=1 Tax=Nocardia sp. CDC160 TaxID=3112166 RepID=UPI002DB66557|nr:hypothetical protein [Nocardia sp. CDC160]MEC3918889.1 hypothetical protein [Nocardia sp. CDC160]
MNTKKTVRYAAFGAALAAAAIPLSSGTAAAAGSIEIWVGPGGGAYGCEVTTVACSLTAYVDDMSTPVTISVDGKALATGSPITGPTSRGQFTTTWTPQVAGAHTVSAQQGSLNQTVSVRILDTNSPEMWIKRVQDYLRELACQQGGSGSGTLLGSGGCMSGGIH